MEYYARMDLGEIGMKIADWMHLTQVRYQWMAVVKTVMNIRIPYNAGDFLTS
jgi:hypothetical protein